MQTPHDPVVTARRVLVVRHHDYTTAGLVGDALRARGFELDEVMADDLSREHSLSGYSMVILTGSKRSVYDEDVTRDWLGAEYSLIRRANESGIGVFGLCFGAQILCAYLGGTVERGTNPEVGWYTVEPDEASGIPAGPWFELHFDHCVTPAEVTVLARTRDNVQAFTAGQNFAVQFHPELGAEQLRGWYDAGRDEPVRRVGLDPATLYAETVTRTDQTRRNTVTLVDTVLAHMGLDPIGPAAT